MKKTADFAPVQVEEAFNLLETSPAGLSDGEAEERGRSFGRNEIVEQRRPAVLDYLARFWGLMPWLLEATALLSLFLGHRLEAAIIIVLLVVNAGIGFWNERNSRKALELLKRRLTVVVNVKRGGQWTKKPATELVPGDVVSVGLGEIVSADLKLFSGEVSVDQSALTGESLPKTVGARGLVYSGSVVRRGAAQGVVLNTGKNTLFGKTAELVKTARAASHQQQIMLRVIQYMLYVSLGAIAIIVLDALWLRTGLVTILTMSLIFLMGAVPVALPAVFTVVLAAGALELSRQAVLVTKLSAIEDAASMTILCLDKTGTITQNQLTVAQPVPWGAASPADVAAAAGMATSSQSRDIIDVAVKAYERTVAGNREYREVSYSPFEPASKRSEAVVEENGGRCSAVKGAAQVVAALCPDLDSSRREEIDEQVRALSAKGLRVLGVARSYGEDMGRLQFMGLLPLADPPRPDSQAMIEEMRSLGVSVKMLTGDNVAIAREIARQVAVGDRILRMADLSHLNDAEQAAALEQNDGVAEIYPEDKHRIVKLLQSRGHIVGMTGDGVNDAPALKQAEVGIAVASATDVAKAAASIVLTEPGLHAIALAIKTSRRIYQRMLSWVINKVTKVVQFVGLLMVGFLIWHEVLISALGMVLLIFANDFITMSLATDNAAGTANPNAWNVKKVTLASLVLGLLLVAQGLAIYAIGWHEFDLPRPQLQTLAMLSLVFTSLFRILIVRERRHFWSSRPGTALMAAVLVTMVAFFLLGGLGWIVPALPWNIVTVVYVFSGAYVMLLDFPKYRIFRSCGF
jgi:H+-transporting ATPase